MTNVTLSLFAGAGAQFLDNSGNVLTGGLIYTYAAGTTTLLATYTSNLGTSTHPNPIVLDASGRVPGGEIWLTTGYGYKFVLKDTNNVLIGTYDNIPSSAQPPIINDASSISYEQGYTVTAGAFIVGQTYLITSIGTTNFQSIGATSNTIGVLFTATGVGSGTGTAKLSRTTQNKLQESVSVKDFGAVGDGVTDDTAAMQRAHNTGNLIYYPKGNYSFTNISFSQGGMIGDGRGSSRLYSQDASGNDLITYTGFGGTFQVPLFKDIFIQANTTKPSGAGLAFVPSSGNLEFVLIDGIGIFNAPTGIKLNDCNYGSIVNSFIINYTLFGIYYQNHDNYGAGDFLISNNHINTGYTTGIRQSIFQDSGGGLRIIGNKVLGGNTGFSLNYSGVVPSGPLVIVGNSFENQDTVSIYLACLSSAFFGGIVITGNEIAQTPKGIQVDKPSTGIIQGMIISGNYIELNGATATSAITLNSASKFNIGSNTLVGIGGTSNGIFTTSGCVNGKISKQNYSNFATTLQNNSSTVFVDADVQTGVVSEINANTPFGSLFYGSAYVIFPTPYTNTPVVNVNAGGAAGIQGGFCAYATHVTTAGFTLNLVSVVSGVTDNNFWNAWGVI